jgi:tetratricopeptide (TPR) repeat protein
MRVLITYLLSLYSMVVFSQQPDGLLLKTRALMDQRIYNEAIENMQHIAKKNTMVYMWLGDCNYGKQDYSNAIRYYLKADSLDRDVASFELSRCYALIQDTHNATLWLQRHMALTHKRTELEIISDTAFIRLSKTKGWEVIWKQNWYSDMETSRNAIAALIEKGKALDALTELERLSNKFSPKHEYFSLSAKAYLKQNLLEPALVYINEAITLYGRSDEYFFLRADILFKTGKYTNALEDITKAIRLNLYIPSYYLKRAEIARFAGNNELAASDLKIYHELYPESPEAYHQLGLLENANGHYLNALDYYDKLIDKDQGKSQYFIERGNNALAANQVEKADENYGMALDLNPNSQDAYLLKGKTRNILQDTQGACFNWKIAKQLGSAEAAKLIYENCKE